MAKTLLDKINVLLNEIEEMEKEAAKDPGGRYGKTKHPSGNLDGGDVEVTYGDHYKELDEALNECLGTMSADADITDHGSGKDYTRSNRKHRGTGDLERYEADESVGLHVKDDKENKDEAEGKFASLMKRAYDQMNEILADIAVGTDDEEYLNNINLNALNNSKQAEFHTNNVNEVLENQSVDNESKADMLTNLAKQTVSQIIKEADYDADLIAEYLQQFAKSAFGAGAASPPISPLDIATLLGNNPANAPPPSSTPTASMSESDQSEQKEDQKNFFPERSEENQTETERENETATPTRNSEEDIENSEEEEADEEIDSEESEDAETESSEVEEADKLVQAMAKAGVYPSVLEKKLLNLLVNSSDKNQRESIRDMLLLTKKAQSLIASGKYLKTKKATPGTKKAKEIDLIASYIRELCN